LDQCWIEDGTLTCSRHMWEFDVLTGKGVNGATHILSV
jgi:nitrite reductase/ring-hydroxylating ferredoxin subunit